MDTPPHSPLSTRGLLVFFGLEFALAAIMATLAPSWWLFTFLSVLCFTGVWAYDNRVQIGKRLATMSWPQIYLFVGIAGVWLFMTVGLGSAAWMIVMGQPFTIGSSAIAGNKPNDGPLIWYRNLSMEGGPALGRNVFALTFSGGNISEKEVELKSANIVSAVNGSRVTLEIVAQGESVPLDQVELIPPGAPVRLVAKFGPPDQNSPGKILGIDSKVFADTWKKFSLNIQDDTKSYRIPFNEGDIAPFFPGIVGPHVSKKASAGK